MPSMRSLDSGHQVTLPGATPACAMSQRCQIAAVTQNCGTATRLPVSDPWPSRVSLSRQNAYCDTSFLANTGSAMKRCPAGLSLSWLQICR